MNSQKVKKKNCHEKGKTHVWMYIKSFLRNDGKWTKYEKCQRCEELRHEITEMNPTIKK